MRKWLYEPNLPLTLIPVPVHGLDDKKIVQIAAGQQHCIALDSTGSVFLTLILRLCVDSSLREAWFTFGATMAIAVLVWGIK